MFRFTFCSISTLTIQCCNVGGAGAGPFWAVQWWWWCWSGSLCRAGAGLLTFLEHPMYPPLLEDLAKWSSWMMTYSCKFVTQDGSNFKIVAKLQKQQRQSTLYIYIALDMRVSYIRWKIKSEKHIVQKQPLCPPSMCISKVLTSHISSPHHKAHHKACHFTVIEDLCKMLTASCCSHSDLH